MRQEGIDDILSNQESSRQFLEDVFREIDIYGNDVNLLQKRFVSPLSRIATDFYKFYLNDTVVVESDSCVVLSFVPHTSETWGFIGKIYVPKNDSTMFIKKIEIMLLNSSPTLLSPCSIGTGRFSSQNLLSCSDASSLIISRWAKLKTSWPTVMWLPEIRVNLIMGL